MSLQLGRELERRERKVNQSINNRGTTETSFSQTPYLMLDRWPEGREVEGRKLQFKNPIVSMIKSTTEINTEPGHHRPVGKGFTVRQGVCTNWTTSLQPDLLTLKKKW